VGVLVRVESLEDLQDGCLQLLDLRFCVLIGLLGNVEVCFGSLPLVVCPEQLHDLGLIDAELILRQLDRVLIRPLGLAGAVSQEAGRTLTAEIRECRLRLGFFGFLGGWLTGWRLTLLLTTCFGRSIDGFVHGFLLCQLLINYSFHFFRCALGRLLLTCDFLLRNRLGSLFEFFCPALVRGGSTLVTCLAFVVLKFYFDLRKGVDSFVVFISLVFNLASRLL
jgi:hypothetical protein